MSKKHNKKQATPHRTAPLLKKRRRRGKLGAILILVTVIGVAAKIVASPVNGHVTDIDIPTAKPVVKHTAPQLPATTVDNPYFQLSLPAGYRVQDSQAAGIMLYQQTVTKPGAFGTLIINIGVKAKPEGGYTEDPSYRLRLQQSNRYTLTPQAVGGDKLQISNDSESAVIVAFWPHAGYLATISVSSGLNNPASDDNRDELRALQPLLSAWQWR